MIVDGRCVELVDPGLLEETAHALEVSPATVKRDWESAKAWLYREIAQGFFEDGSRMERLDVIFANRYLDEYDRFHAGLPTKRQSRQIAFDATESWWPIVLQHLLLGMNAHINLDLAIAAAETCPGSEIDALEGDFSKINEVLVSLIDDVEDALSSFWHPLWLLDKVGGRSDEVIIEFSLERARAAAWDCAVRLTCPPMRASQRPTCRNVIVQFSRPRLPRTSPSLYTNCFLPSQTRATCRQ